MTAALDLVVDTDVWSFLFRNDTRADRYRQAMIGRRLGISAQTVAELMRGARAAGWSSARTDKLLLALRPFKVLALTGDTARHWAAVRHERDALGQPITAQDAWIAATALREGCPLLTHNARHFSSITGLNVMSFADAAG
jgi:tRNA(fMet)-specific endonuclease VapC